MMLWQSAGLDKERLCDGGDESDSIVYEAGCKVVRGGLVRSSGGKRECVIGKRYRLE